MMSFNPNTCEGIHIIKKRNPIIHDYKIYKATLQSVKSGKYLGVNIANNLSLNTHIESTTKKANTSLSFLRRNITSCPQDIKAQTYKTLARHILEYAGTVCDPHTATNINQLEVVQKRAARFVKVDYRTTSSTTATPPQQRQAIDGLQDHAQTHSHPNSRVLPPLTLGGHGYGHRFNVPLCRTDDWQLGNFHCIER